MTTTITSLEEAMAVFEETFARHPERNEHAAVEAALDGRSRPYPVLGMNFLGDPTDRGDPRYAFELPAVEMADGPEGRLARSVVNMLAPLRMLNPIRPAFGFGSGPGTLVTCFGIPLNPDTGNSPAFTRSIRDVLAKPPPAPGQTGLVPEILESIEHAKALTPNRFKISMPDTQGPFNLAHSIVGEEIMLAPCTDAGAYHAIMDRITTFWVATIDLLRERIGPDRLEPRSRAAVTICECSVNLVSPDFYREFILPYDLRIAEHFPSLAIHPCSGPHVFRVTLENLPKVIWTEAGHIARTAAGSICVDDALAAIGKRPITLQIGQELPEGGEYEFVVRDLDLAGERPKLLFGYTGMHWRKRDAPRIREIHRRLDDYWAERYGAR